MCAGNRSGDSVFGSDGAQASPGQRADFSGDRVGIEVLAKADQATACALGQTDERVRQRFTMRLVDVHGDQRCNRSCRLRNNFTDCFIELIVTSRARAKQQAEAVVVIGDPAEIGTKAQFGLAFSVRCLSSGLTDVRPQPITDLFNQRLIQIAF